MKITFSVTLSIDENQISQDEIFEHLEDRITQSVSELPSVVLIDFSESRWAE